jgi:hypothetical protein
MLYKSVILFILFKSAVLKLTDFKPETDKLVVRVAPHNKHSANFTFVLYFRDQPSKIIRWPNIELEFVSAAEK